MSIPFGHRKELLVAGMHIDDLVFIIGGELLRLPKNLLVDKRVSLFSICMYVSHALWRNLYRMLGIVFKVLIRDQSRTEYIGL